MWPLEKFTLDWILLHNQWLWWLWQIWGMIIMYYLFSRGYGFACFNQELGFALYLVQNPADWVPTAQRPTKYRPKIYLERLYGFSRNSSPTIPLCWVLESKYQWLGLLSGFTLRPCIRVLELNGRWVPPWRHTQQASRCSDWDRRPAIIKTLAGVPNHFRIFQDWILPCGAPHQSGLHLSLSSNISPYPQDRRQIWAVPL